MNTERTLQIGDVSENGQVTIVDEDRLCYLVKSDSRGSVGLRTISKRLLNEYVHFFAEHQDANPNIARDELSGKSDIDKFEYGYTSTLTTMARMVLELATKAPCKISPKDKNIGTLQQIFYGAPGTGKSHEIKEQTEGKQVIRTTFHPDSDYSTFVGAYKPTTVDVPMMTVIGTKATPVENADGTPRTETKIEYEFVAQAFLQAYIKAWKQYAFTEEGKTPEEIYLVIEEINRGNCAQIFGDLFQLLDRGDEGFSEYPIVADKDLQKHLAKAFVDMPYLNAPAIGGMTAEEVAVKIRKGEILLLPKNLYIWATMNTSDQSLFPIDSAFKRRWNWCYVPISDQKKGYKIAVNGNYYDWWEFLDAINGKIWDTNHSEDKKLGDFFAKAEGDNVINSELFVGKVIFYLWNDVFKDFIDESGDIFKDEDGSTLSFDKFYETLHSGETKVVDNKVEIFLKNLKLEPTEYIKPQFYGDTEFGKSAHLKVTFPNGTIIEYNNTGETLVNFIMLAKPMRVAEHKIMASYSQNRELIQTQNIEEYQTKSVGDGYYVITKLGIEVIFARIIQISEELDLDCDVKIIYPEGN